jgi:methylglutaconyl-CoA hydratase
MIFRRYYSHINVARRRPQVVEIEMSRGQIHNAFNDEMIGELKHAFLKYGAEHYDDSSDFDENELPIFPVRAIVLSGGNGPSFSAGADLNWMRRMAEYSHEENVEDALRLFDMFRAIKQSKVPVIGRVNGAALGGGAGLVCACDFAFGLDSERSWFGFTEVKLGLLPAVISPFVIERIGAAAASRYFVSGEAFDVNEARRVGMLQAQQCATVDELDEAVDRALDYIGIASPQAVAASKKLVATNVATPLDELREKLANEIASIRVSEEGQHGLRSFLDKEKPRWIFL